MRRRITALDVMMAMALVVPTITIKMMMTTVSIRV